MLWFVSISTYYFFKSLVLFGQQLRFSKKKAKRFVSLASTDSHGRIFFLSVNTRSTSLLFLQEFSDSVAFRKKQNGFLAKIKNIFFFSFCGHSSMLEQKMPNVVLHLIKKKRTLMHRSFHGDKHFPPSQKQNMPNVDLHLTKRNAE